MLLTGHLLAGTRAWLSEKPAGTPLFPGKWAKQSNGAKLLRRDARRAKIAEQDAKGQELTFHSLRSYYCTRLIESGATFDELRRLARHRSLATTLAYYARSDLKRLGAAADKLKPPG